MVHLATHVQSEADLTVIVRGNDTIAGKLPVAFLVIEVDAAAGIPVVAVVCKQHIDPAEHRIIFAHLLGERLAPTARSETITRATFTAKLLIQGDRTVVTTSQTNGIGILEEAGSHQVINGIHF